MEDCCAVCAEPLEWTAYGPCGHKDACSKCVTRLRFVMGDKRCVICQQQHPAVFVTRFMGDYTKTLPPEEFDKLKARSSSGQVYYLPAAETYFDDQGQYKELKGLCSYTHPCLDNCGEAVPVSRNLKDLKRQMQIHCQLSFCDVCLESRKVFISEQVAYNKADIDRHQRVGDLTGPLAESGFKGHPQCKYCRKRFYGDNEIFAHMQSQHEFCFLCRRARPDKYVYYRDYPELEEHFRHEHYQCEHPECLEQKFVVFASEQDLKQHNAREHGGNMSRSERRQALTIPVNFQYRRGDDGAEAAVAGPSRGAAAIPGIVIGGAGGVRSRFRRRSAGESEQRAIANALQASMDSAATDRAVRESGTATASTSRQGDAGASGSRDGPGGLNDEDFPLPEGAGPSGSGGHWAATAGGARGMAPRPEDFPALPGTSKSAKRRAKANRTLAERLGGEVRVVNRSAECAEPLIGAGPPVDPFPTLRHSSSTPAIRNDSPQQYQPPARERRPPQINTSQPADGPAGSANSSGSGSRHADGQLVPESPQGQAIAAPHPDEFPALGGSRTRGRNGVTAARPAQPQPAASVVRVAAAAAPSLRTPTGYAARPPSAADFPALGAAAQRSAPAAGPSSDAAAQPAAGGISEGLKAANKALIDKIRRQLDADKFDEFKRESGAFMRGSLPASAFHQEILSLGLAAIVPELAALCPDAQKRNTLLEVHRDSFSQAPSQGQGSWVPPEVAAAAADHARQFGSWACSSCTLINGPQAQSCEACRARRPAHDAAEASGSQEDADDEQTLGSEKGKAKQKKIPKFERLRLTGGDGVATKSWLETNGGQKVKPQNVWTQARGQAGPSGQNDGVGPQQGPQSSWAKAPGKLATEAGAINDAWSKKR
ncbi:hypothetical protein WJX72_011657 [[Myrmecia] bisecta]|uniref:RING-type E3 ubiquitin transferase n=1 Tax=[Myrmecia] bisecta TaxID=41462 RepID=A0AAW1QGI5_9CHLO